MGFNGFNVVVAGLMTMAACGDSSGGTASDSNGVSQSGTGGVTEPTGGDTEPTGGASMSGTTGAEGGMSDSLSGTTGAEGGMSDSLSGTVSSGVESDSMSGSGSSATMTTGMTGTSVGTEGTEGTEDGGDETSTGDPVDCASFVDEVLCKAAGCMAIVGRRFVSDDAMFCLDPSSFLACTEEAACAGVITTACKGQVKYQLPNACIPDNFVQCDPPADPDMDGYVDCQ
jgi:hypothetical protein